jgi:hypothetical protein
MITQLSESEGHVLGVRISGKVSSEMEKEWIGKLEKVIKKHGKINILILLDKQATWGLKAGIEDLKWILTNMKEICKIAIIADSHFWKWYVALDSPFGKVVGIGEKYFNPAEMDAAWKWIKE